MSSRPKLPRRQAKLLTVQSSVTSSGHLLVRTAFNIQYPLSVFINPPCMIMDIYSDSFLICVIPAIMGVQSCQSVVTWHSGSIFGSTCRILPSTCIKHRKYHFMRIHADDCINFKVTCRLQSFSNGMFCSCRICTDKRVAQSLYNSRASCFVCTTLWCIEVDQLVIPITTSKRSHRTCQNHRSRRSLWPPRTAVLDETPESNLLVSYEDACRQS